MPQPRPKQHEAIETHRDMRRQLPFGIVNAVLFDDVRVHLLKGGIAAGGQLFVIDRGAVAVRADVTKEVGSTPAVFIPAKVQNAGPVAVVDMDLGPGPAPWVSAIGALGRPSSLASVSRHLAWDCSGETATSGSPTSRDTASSSPSMLIRSRELRPGKAPSCSG